MADPFLDRIFSDLGPTWWIVDTDPGLDDMATQAGDCLKPMIEALQIYPFQAKQGGGDRLFLARFEFPVAGADFQYPQAATAQGAIGWLDFLGGFPIDDCEMLMVIGQFSSLPPANNPSQVTVTAYPQTKIVAPVPHPFFQWPDKGKILMNLTALAQKTVKLMATNLADPKPHNPHWWARTNLLPPTPFPVPGEFLALGCRMMPDRPSGYQKSSPFMYSGNFMATVYYDTAVIISINDPTDDIPYPTYLCQWRKQQITVTPSDFAEYKVKDRVTILKDVAATKTSELWSDDDMSNLPVVSQVCPVCFYGLETPAS